MSITRELHDSIGYVADEHHHAHDAAKLVIEGEELESDCHA